MIDKPPVVSNDLRSKAQAMLERAPEVLPPLDQALEADPAAMLEELRIHQAELEVQNDELRRTRLEAQEAHHYYLSLFDSLPIQALVLDTHGLIIEANQQTYELFGFRSAAMLRRHSIYRLMLTSSATALAETLRQPVEREHPLPLPDLSVRSASGEMLVMEAHIARLPSLAAPERRFLLLMIDRTQERDLARQTQLYETIINHANSIIYAFDADQRCILANDSMLQLLGRPRQEVLGRLRADLVPAEDSAQYDKNDAKVWSTGQPVV
ncbi:MAG: PAS domain-containing protein, partial [Burkholderiaceae bacterium]|nr:PAS domain-containing protein [Burkholderiaceae bacterium]